MKIIFKDKNKEIQLENNQLLHILSPNGFGKTTLINTLYDGLKGKLKDKFLVDGNVVDKDEYFILLISDNLTIDIETAWTTKSILKNEIDLLELDGYQEEIVDKIDEINNLIESFLKSKLNYDIELNVDLSIDKILKKNLKITYHDYDVDMMSFSEKRLLLIDLYLEILSNSHKKKILLVDEFALNLSKPNIRRLINKLNQYNDIIIFITSSYGKVNDEDCWYFNDNGYCNELIDYKEYFMQENNISSSVQLEKYYLKEELESFKVDPKIYQEVENYFFEQKIDNTLFYKILHNNLK